MSKVGQDIDDMREFSKKVHGNVKAFNVSQTAVEVDPPLPLHSDVKMTDVKMWAVADDAYIGCESSINELPAGPYLIRISADKGVYFKKHTISTDDLLPLPDSASSEIIDQLKRFWLLEEHFRSFGFLWKRGILLWGPPGSGKTSTIHLTSKDVISKNGLTIFIEDPPVAILGLQILRKIEPKRKIVVILEDLDAMATHHQSSLLALLDGENQIDNVVYIATTNYPERLDNRFINRPSRFDVIKKIGMPNPSARRMFLENKNTRLRKNHKELEKWIVATEEFSLAHMKELIISVEVFQCEFDDALNRLKTMMDCDLNSKDYGRKDLGFKPAIRTEMKYLVD